MISDYSYFVGVGFWFAVGVFMAMSVIFVVVGLVNLAVNNLPWFKDTKKKEEPTNE